MRRSFWWFALCSECVSVSYFLFPSFVFRFCIHICACAHNADSIVWESVFRIHSVALSGINTRAHRTHSHTLTHTCNECRRWERANVIRCGVRCAVLLVWVKHVVNNFSHWDLSVVKRYCCIAQYMCVRRLCKVQLTSYLIGIVWWTTTVSLMCLDKFPDGAHENTGKTMYDANVYHRHHETITTQRCTRSSLSARHTMQSAQSTLHLCSTHRCTDTAQAFKWIWYRSPVSFNRYRNAKTIQLRLRAVRERSYILWNIDWGK